MMQDKVERDRRARFLPQRINKTSVLGPFDTNSGLAITPRLNSGKDAASTLLDLFADITLQLPFCRY
ncbi:MAG: hypothetical protein WCG03_01130 [Kiritimatiellales bacterium]